MHADYLHHRSAELIRRAEHHRLVREALRARRAARRAEAGRDAGRTRGDRFVRAA
ncbi:hypothetical protein [Streptomyces sp. CRN 30]|uniref:hypothetical protein n=1 Tax=Streptomyces sp. CRN 30 TaxID=3075613 RepID=UPI002A82CE06|nr:hypothetical protein [Streptomyces sp. CRN 30]